MRVEADIPSERIKTSHRLEAADRFVNLNVFVPHATFAPPAIHTKRNQWLLEGVKTWINSQALDSTFAATPSWAKELDAVKKAVSATDVTKAVNQLSMRLTNAFPAAPPQRFSIFAGKSNLKSQATQFMQLRVFKSLLDRLQVRLLTLPLGVPQASSAIGFLFLDRTRIRPVGCDIGEQFDSIPLILGQEALSEVRTSVHRTTTIEDSIEREYENALEQSSQEVRTDLQTSSGQTSTTSGTTTGVTANVGTPDTSSVPVDASLGLSQNNTFNQAQNDATQHSLTVATTTASRVTAKLRENHKATLKKGVEESFETLSRNTLRNVNQARPIIVHYFKCMQRLELQHERLGVRLCWAPFILDPGAGARFRAIQEHDRILTAATDAVSKPAPPLPPKKQYGPTWVKGEPLNAGGGGFLSVNIYSSQTITLGITLDDANSFTGRVRVAVSGMDKDVVHAKVVGEPYGPTMTTL